MISQILFSPLGAGLQFDNEFLRISRGDIFRIKTLHFGTQGPNQGYLGGGGGPFGGVPSTHQGRENWGISTRFRRRRHRKRVFCGAEGAAKNF